MVTKRTIMGIQERVNSAIERLSSMAATGQPISAYDVSNVVQRDLAPASDDLSYVFSVAD